MPPIRLNAAKRKLQENGVVTTISGNLTSEIIDFMGPLGFDAVWIECEHGGVTWEQLGDMTRACDLWGLTPITRVNSNEPWSCLPVAGGPAHLAGTPVPANACRYGKGCLPEGAASHHHRLGKPGGALHRSGYGYDPGHRQLHYLLAPGLHGYPSRI